MANYPYYDSGFDVTDHGAQSAISDLCTSVAADSDLVYNNEVYCFMDDFKEFLAANGKTWADGTHGAEILTPAFMNYQQLLFVQRYSTGGHLTGVVANGHNENVTTLATADAASLDTFAFISFNSTLPLKTNLMTLSQMRSTVEKWQAHIDVHNAANPKAQGIQYCLIWYFMNAGEAIVDSTMVGVTISLIFAATVLVVANMNYIIAGLAMLTIFGVIALVSLMMVALDWSIDFLGSVCLIVVIGLSVDYTVHLCHSYTHSPLTTSFDRTKQAATEMGVSIWSGAITR